MRTGLVLLLVSATAWPRPAPPHYDLDSLVWLSRSIVEAEYAGERRVRVLRSYLGNIETGTSLKCRLYPVVDSDQRTSTPLAPGARVILFLDQEKRCVTSGAWLVEGGRVHRPTYGAPHGNLVWTPDERGVDENEFRRQLPGRIRHAKEIQERIETTEAFPELLELLRARDALYARPGNDDLRLYDVVARAICLRLATLRDYGALAEALRFDLGRRASLTLARAFGTPGGRDELLRRIADEQTPPEARVALAGAIADTGAFYRSEYVRVEDRWRYERHVDKGNSGYLTRVAKLAASLTRHGDLCATLCEQIRLSVDPELRTDVKGAVRFLIAVHRTARSERARFEAARALAAIGPRAYGWIDSPAGSALGRLEIWREEAGLLRFRLEYHEPRCQFDRSVLVFERNGQETEVPVSVPRLDGGSGVSSEWSDAPPKGLRAGRYRVWIRLYRDGVAVSNGYGCEIDLP
jgi:hypothetical protein